MTTSHFQNHLSGTKPLKKPVSEIQNPSVTPVSTDLSTTESTVQDKFSATENEKASDHMLTAGSRKRSILLNMMLPPEPLAVDAKLAIPPVILFPPILEPEGTITVQDRSMDVSAKVTESHSSASETTSNSTSWSLRSWAWGASHDAGRLTKRSKGHQSQEDGHNDSSGGKGGIMKSINVVESKTTTTVSKTTQVRTWISRIAGSKSENDDKNSKNVPATSTTKTRNSAGIPEATLVSGELVQQQEQQQQLTTGHATVSSQTQADQQGNMMAVQQRQEIIHQEIHQKTRSVALVNVNVSVSDVFGIGKMMEVILALFHAHGAFLRRNPFWLQCVLMTWEMVIVLLLVWGILRIVGLAEVIVWGADDLIRGTLSTVQLLGRTLQSYLSPY
ncbi:hypothetical protein FBU30_007844 [Linnemannia zychae]|nr:hypothetical protein FBU30_007844 [Linnemannia zychae]